VPFRTPLSVRHEVGEDWRLLEPLVFEGRRDFFVIRQGFRTDFASIPRPVRWLFDTAGTNSEPAVLHDAVWRESKRTDGQVARVDPWDADGLFRRALRESGATALTRGLMWIAVRAAAIAAGRFGRSGPPLPLKVAQVAGMAATGVATVGAPTAVAVVGRAFYWLVEWVVALAWAPVERARGTRTNLPWPASEGHERREDPPREYLVVIPIDSAAGAALAGMLGPGNGTVLPDDVLDGLVPGTSTPAH
jgi:Protein of unknown function (DUF1353)